MGGKNSSMPEQINQNAEKSQKDLEIIRKKCLENEEEEFKKERKGDMETNLTIRVYSENQVPLKYKIYLESIKLDNWNIIYLDNGFSSEATKTLIDNYKKKSEEKRKFDEVLIIIIDSYNSFIDAMEIDTKNFLENFNNLYNEQQPLFLFLNKNLSDFEYISKEIRLYDYTLYLESECLNFISEIKEEYYIEMHYTIKYIDYTVIKSFIDKKKINKDNFNVIFENNQEFIYSSKYYPEDNENNILEYLSSGNILIVRNLDCDIKLKEDLDYLKEISKKNKVKIHFRYYKAQFNEKFDNFISQYELLDKRNFKVQYFYYSPFLNLQKYCGYYHEYGDFIIKDNFFKYPSKINIGVCGRAGSGKSTLLNVILGEKRCLEGQGTSVSTFITRYTHPKYPISFLDFPGFCDKDNAEIFIKKLREKNSELKDIKEEFHVFIYCLRFGDRSFLIKEDDVIYELMKLNILVIFVFTRGDYENTPEFGRFKHNFLNGLSEILKKKKINIDIAKEIKIVSIYSMKEKKNGYIFKPFGIDTLFEIIYDNLKNKKIEDYLLEQIKSTNDEEKFNEIFKNNRLMTLFISRKELIHSIRKKAESKLNYFLARIILTSPKYLFKKKEAMFLSLQGEVYNLLYEISFIYCIDLKNDESQKIINDMVYKVKDLVEFALKLSEEEKFKTKNIPILFRILGVIFSPIAILVGSVAAGIFSKKINKFLTEEFEKGQQINLSSYISLFCEGLNKGIDGIHDLSEVFKKKYENE